MKDFFKFIFLFMTMTMTMIIGYAVLAIVSIFLVGIVVYGLVMLVVETALDPSMPIIVFDVCIITFSYHLIKSKNFKSSVKELYLQFKRNL